MEFRKVLALRGPNIWANFPVLEAWVDLGPFKDTSSDEVPGFNERLMSWLPTLIEHRCSIGERGGFLERLRRGTYPAHILEHLTLELQSLAGTEVGYGRARATSEEGVYKVAIEYQAEELGRACLEAGRDVFLAALNGHEFDIAARVRELQELARRVLPDASTAALLEAARRRTIPVVRLGNSGLVQLGHGQRQRRLLGTQTDQTSQLAVSISQDPELTSTLLRAAGVPVADEPVAGEAWRLLVVGDRVVAAVTDSEDGTARIHPDVADLAVEAARAVGLDVAGVEVSAKDIGKPLSDQGGVVSAVVPSPDLARYAVPGSDALPRVADAVLAEMFPGEQNGRIPIVAVTGVNGKTTTTRLIAHVIARTQRTVGMTCTDGIYVGGRRIETGDCSGPLSARAILQNPRVEAAVLETARGGILRSGLGFDRCDVAVVTNIADGDHLGIADIETAEQLAKVKRTIVDVVLPGGTAVLKADDPLVAAMADHCPGSVLYFARDGNHPLIKAQREKKGRAAFVREGRIILAEGDQEIPLIALERVPLTYGGRVAFQVENTLAAAAAAWALGIPCEVIRAGLENFTSDLESAPGRFNVLEINGATVIMDYGHNVASLECLIEVLDQFPHRRRLAVYSAAGDRRDADLIAQGELLGHAFDRVILYEEDNCIRGRKPGEITALFRKGLAAARRTGQIEEIVGAVRAAEVALETAAAGDLILIQVDLVDETVELARRYLAAARQHERTVSDTYASMPVRAKVQPVPVG